MEQELPTWLDVTFLSAILQGGDHNEPAVTIIQFSVNPAVPVGNNFMSHLYRVVTQYKVGESDELTISIIVKAPITKGVVNEMVEKLDFFGKEIKMYTEVIPKMYTKLNFEFSPSYFYSPIKNVLVLKDLKKEGYIACDKYKQFDYSHCKYIFKTLAKFHAASVACYHDNPDLIISVGKEIQFAEGGPFEEEMKVWSESSMRSVGEIANEMEECRSLAYLLFDSANNVASSFKKICKPKEKGLNVLNHGDLWINNILFKINNSGEIIDVRLIDYQVTRFASPVIDLIYFICTSVNEDVLKNNLHCLYDVYLKSLNKTLEELGCKERLTEEELQEDFRSYIDWAAVTICTVLPLMVCEKENIINMEDVKKEDYLNSEHDLRLIKLYNDKHYLSLLPKLLRLLSAWVSV